MGNQTKQAIFNGHFRDKKWQYLSINQLSIPGQPRIVRTTDETIAADQYFVKERPENSDFQRQKIIYQQRASSMTGNLVNIFSVQQINHQSEFKEQINALRVRTERIPWRLHEAKDLQVFQAMYILQGAIHGYYEIMQHVKEPFLVTSEMIGLNTFGRVKVWANPNFAINQVLNCKYKIGSVKAMLQQIILVVEFHVKDQCFPDPIRNSIFAPSSISDFLSLMARIQLLLNYSKERKVQIGKKLVDNVALNQALRQYAENRQNQRQKQKHNGFFQNENPKNSQGAKQVTTNYNHKQQTQGYNIVQFQRKAVKLNYQKQNNSFSLNAANQSQFKQGKQQDVENNANIDFRSQHVNTHGLVFQKRSIKTYSLNNQNQSHNHNHNHNHQKNSHHQQSGYQHNSKNTDHFNDSKLKKEEKNVKKSVVIAKTPFKESYSKKQGIVKSQIFNYHQSFFSNELMGNNKKHQKSSNLQKSPHARKVENIPHQAKYSDQKISNSSIKQNPKQNTQESKSINPSHLQQNSSLLFQRKPIFQHKNQSRISHNQQAKKNSDLPSSRSLTPTIARREGQALKKLDFNDKKQLEVQNDQQSERKQMGQIRKNYVKHQQQQKNHLLFTNKKQQMKNSQIKATQFYQNQKPPPQIKKQYSHSNHLTTPANPNYYQSSSVQTQRVLNVNNVQYQNHQNLIAKNQSNFYSTPNMQPNNNIGQKIQRNQFVQRINLQGQKEASTPSIRKRISNDSKNLNSNHDTNEQLRRSQLTNTSHFGGLDSNNMYTLKQMKKSNFVHSDKTLNKPFVANRYPIFGVQGKQPQNQIVQNHTVQIIPESSLQSDKFSFNPDGTTYAVNNSNHAKLAFFSPFKSMHFSQNEK